MAPSSTDRAYFLGELPPDEATRLELAVMEDAAVAERLEGVEAELIDDYLEGLLSPQDRQRFEAFYMAVPGRANRVRLARELSRRATRTSRAEPSARSSRPHPLRLLLPMAATLLVAAGLWFADRRPSAPQVATAPSPLPTIAIAAAPSPSPKAPVAATPTPGLLRQASFVLAMAVTRGGAVQEFKAPGGADIVDFEIDLEGETRFAEFDARLTDASGREIWRHPRSSPLRPTRAGVLVVPVPTASGLLAAGRLELEISGRAAGQSTSLATMTISFKP